MTRRRWLCVRLAAAGDFGGPLRRPSSDATRPCALACHGLRRAAAAFARRRQSCSADSPAGERRSLGLAPCPTQKRCSSCGARSPASARRGPLRSPPRLRPRSVGDCRPSSRSSLGLALPGRTLRGPPRSAGAPPLCVGIRSGRSVVVAALLRRRSVARLRPFSLASPALRGPGFLPGPLPTAGSAGVTLLPTPGRPPGWPPGWLRQQRTNRRNVQLLNTLYM